MRKCLMIGAGGMAGYWIRGVFAAFKDRTEIVGLVDVRPDVLASAGEFLGLKPDRCFTDMSQAFASVEADYCTIVIPPGFHEQAVMLAVERKMPILSEKPIADTWEACCRIYRVVSTAKVPMQVVQNYRFTPRIRTLKSVLDDGRLGDLHYVISRFAADYRQRGAWGAPFRHEIPHALLVEGSVHHFDQIRNISNADCASIAGWEWNPPNPSFDGESIGLYTMKMTNGVHASYEGNCLEGGTQNSWHEEMYRAECEGGAIAIDKEGIVRVFRHEPRQGVSIEEIPLVRQIHEGHEAILVQFLNWQDGGPIPPTFLGDNIRSAAMLFAAIRASKSNQAIDVTEVLREAT